MLAALALIAAAVAPGTYAVDPSASTLRYSITHKLHQVEGTSHEMEGKAIVRPDGSVITQVRAPIASFKSGDGNRDEHMLETMNVGSFPFVVFKGVARAGEGPVQLNGQLELHGVKKDVPVTVEVERQPDGALRVKGHLDVSLTAHRIERPSLLFIQIDDACVIAIDLLLREAR
jgi:polyisoprenoid-binding protein YceI